MQTDIEDEYAFTAWISLKLDPIVRNDPKKIASYIVAALSKNRDAKDAKSLRLYCRRKLEEFVEDKEKLNEFCEELCAAVDDSRYLEVREHPSYATLLDQDTGPLTPSNKEYPLVKEEKRYEDNSQSRKRRSGSYSDDADESIEDRPPHRGRITPDKKAAVSSTISVVEDNISKRLGKRPNTMGKLTCKDFTERGYCLRGQLCPFDHGSDPVVWQNARPHEVIRYTGPPRAPHPGMPQPQRLPGFPPMMPMAIMRPMPPRFRPDGPPGMGFNMRPKPPPANFRPRELVGLPAVEMAHAGGDLGKREGDIRIVNSMPAKRMALDDTSGNCSLEIHQIPFQLNNIAALNAHFFKYGNIVNVQVRYNGDPASALVTFQTPDAANRAFNSSEPVLNNRFISIAWHNPAKPTQETTKWSAKTVPSAAPVPREKEQIPQEPPATRPSEEPSEVTVTRGFTQGLRVRYPVGARRARAGRYLGAAAVRGSAAASHSAVSQQSQGLTAHHRSIFLSLQASKTETEVEEAQIQLTAVEEKCNKITGLIRDYQETSDQAKTRHSIATGDKKEQLAEMVEKFDKQIQTWQSAYQRFEEQRVIAAKRVSDLEALLSSQKHQIELQKFVHEKESGVEHEEMEIDNDSSSYAVDRGPPTRSRPLVQRASRGRVALLRGTRGTTKRASGVTRFRRPSRGKPFNRTVDRRPRRLKLSGFEETEKQTVLDQIQASGGTVELDNISSLTVNFNTRYDAESFLRELTAVFEGRKMTSNWLPDSRISQDDHVLDLQNLDLGADSSRDAVDSDADERKKVLRKSQTDEDENSNPVDVLSKQVLTADASVPEEGDAR